MKKIAVIGVGKLGLCFSIYLNIFKNFEVIGIDKNKNIIKNYTLKKHKDKKIQYYLKKSCINFSTKIDDAKNADLIFIFVDTPSLKNGNYDHSNILNILSTVESFNEKKIIAIGSTVMPGFCQKLQTKHKIVYIPQFISQGSVLDDIINPDFVLIGADDKTFMPKLRKLFDRKKIQECSLLESEIIKISLNCFVTMKITFANLVGDLCKFVACNENVVLGIIAKDKRVNMNSFNYGYGYGGPCFPRDNKAFSNYMNIFFKSQLNQVVDLENKKHLNNQLNLIKKGIFPNNLRKEKKSYIITKISYNGRADMIEESQILKLALELSKKEKVIIEDNLRIIRMVKKKYNNIFKYRVL